LRISTIIPNNVKKYDLYECIKEVTLDNCDIISWKYNRCELDLFTAPYIG
jgi:hypothetical protein